MKKVIRLKVPATMSLLLVLSMSVLFAPGARTLRAQTNSAANSQPSGTPVSQDEALRAACAEAIEELKAARKLIKAQDVALTKDAELASLQSQVEDGLRKLRALDAEEKANLWKAVDAANREITALKAANAVLKKNQVTVWKQIKWFVIGAGAGAAACAFFCNE